MSLDEDAIYNDDVQAVVAYVRAIGGYAQLPPDEANRLFYSAVSYNSLDVARYFLEHGIDVDHLNSIDCNFESSALHVATKTAICKWLNFF